MMLIILDENEFKLFNSKQYGYLDGYRGLSNRKFYSDDTQRKFAIDALQKISESELRNNNVESMIDN